MLAQVVERCGRAPAITTADAGYYSDTNVTAARALGTDPHIATGRHKRDEPRPRPRGRIPAGLSMKQLMARKLRTRPGALAYSRRKAVVEPVNGQIKQARGFRQFLLRDLEKVRGELALICTGHNLLKLYSATA